ncbi:UDP-N-acetylglucosamine--N-acetylmuramyl-(pentapeptide) pyrophosphoryl-undecaprenol N-acetylglucosamine transferase [Streptomyces zhihengii]|uniref:UDP-N-acetylglucosamine--N-acetylmuramyl-(pentapeptide) pyrophosphoryl-undecaprenol N-acetylglucosamine transferase n=1 Tax=Streptomyces zhihengii TaxID=1818004 RepID=A0ABS2V2V8_9ACTN|nr:UDP-N-acetylglucosamine--N-acetylmuramyl-(pentapeptide) pyrophosphoryl-undecaprenol N-acetylglucosamine transferase [Streptomyces zhihengii]MBM9624185.1 UDP-N-acetylglucosamine--N-acetylmuramyl-(pentapeptide) pyrophosphoryl-undecaprenol N-acetylglucosamine transferase [Streptomyces zhihengii]
MVDPSRIRPPQAANSGPFRLLVTGGGTGGHTYPALTTLRTVQQRLALQGVALDVLWAGSAEGLEARVTAAEGIRFTEVATGKIRRSKNPLKLVSPANVKDMSNVPRGVAQARRIVADFAPHVVLATGGYVAIPIGLAARMCRRPLVVHEQTVRLGLANRVLARAATRIAVSAESTLGLLPDSVRAAAVVTGNPVRAEVLSGTAEKAIEALSLHGFRRALPTVYVTGGAQGSVQINNNIQANLPWLLERANVVHQCGPANEATLREAAAALPAELAARYHVTGFTGAELPDVLALADVVVSRSGAGTIAELTALGKAAVLIPLASSAGNEQAHSALHLQEAGAAVALVDDVSPAALQSALHGLLTHPERRAAVAGRAREQGRPDASERLADVVLAAADRG